MDPPRPPSATPSSSKRKFAEDDIELPSRRESLLSQSSPTSLPSIHELQPFLPPPGPRHAQFSGDIRFQPMPPLASEIVGEGSSGRLLIRDEFAANLSPEQPHLEAGDSDGDGDGDDALRRPKQKRRRQALSCTGQWSC